MSFWHSFGTDLDMTYKYVYMFIFIWAGLSGHAQDKDIIIEVRDAFRSASSKEVAKLLNETVDMKIQGNVKSYSKSQAEIILRDFFKKNPPVSFTIIHHGASKTGLPYAIGEYKSNADTYRVWVRVKKINNVFLVTEIRFIKD